MASNNHKNYYKILGVQEDADELVIRASYRALLSRYNLDDWKGDKQHAIKMLADINEAYSVLKDRYERLEYSSSMVKNQKDEVIEPIQSNMSAEEVEAAWNVACKYYEDLNSLYFNLLQISEGVANDFKHLILSSKDYSARNKFALKLELDYLSSKFGNDQDLIMFGRELILEGCTEAVEELHQVVIIMGGSVQAHEVIEKISEKYQSHRFFIEREKANAAQLEFAQEQKRLSIEKKKNAESLASQRKSSESLAVVILLLIIIFIGLIVFNNSNNESKKTKLNSVATHQSINNNNLLPVDKFAGFKNLSLGEFKGVGDGSNVTLSVLTKGEDFWVELTTVAMSDLRTPAGEPVYCSGGVAGKLASSSHDVNIFLMTKSLYEGTSSNEFCTIKFTRLIHADGYSIEENNCSFYHGMKCSFNSSYLARK